MPSSALVRALRGETTIDELTIVRPDGDERIIRSAVAPIPIGGKIELAVSVATDVTKAKRYERERADLLEREREARGRAERAEAGQRFLSEATAILSSSLEYEKTLELVTPRAVPKLADCCAVALQDEEREACARSAWRMRIPQSCRRQICLMSRRLSSRERCAR